MALLGRQSMFFEQKKTASHPTFEGLGKKSSMIILKKQREFNFMKKQFCLVQMSVTTPLFFLHLTKRGLFVLADIYYDIPFFVFH